METNIKMLLPSPFTALKPSKPIGHLPPAPGRWLKAKGPKALLCIKLILTLPSTGLAFAVEGLEYSGTCHHAFSAPKNALNVTAGSFLSPIPGMPCKEISICFIVLLGAREWMSLDPSRELALSAYPNARIWWGNVINEFSIFLVAPHLIASSFISIQKKINHYLTDGWLKHTHRTKKRTLYHHFISLQE